MIIFSKLNELGRLGNQLFQYSFTRLVAEKNNFTYGVPEWPGRILFENLDKDSYPELISYSIFTEDSSITENAYPYYSLESFNDNTNLVGYFLNHQYYTDNKNFIHSIFKLESSVQEDLNLIISKISQNIPLVSIHIRVSDFLGYGDTLFPILSDQYYCDAIEEIYKTLNTRSIVFLICSDESENTLLKNYSFLSKINYIYQHEHVILDLFSMASCDAHILANSTFSWWAGFLDTKSSPTVYPKNWACRDWVYPKNLACPEWISIYDSTHFINKVDFKK